jgi:dihydroorotate dehydrogenase
MSGVSQGPSSQDPADHERWLEEAGDFDWAGGVCNAEDAYRKIRLGASLVQTYTALIYEGPGIVRRINRGLCQLLQRDGLWHVSEAVGKEA